MLNLGLSDVFVYLRALSMDPLTGNHRTDMPFCLNIFFGNNQSLRKNLLLKKFNFWVSS